VVVTERMPTALTEQETAAVTDGETAAVTDGETAAVTDGETAVVTDRLPVRVARPWCSPACRTVARRDDGPPHQGRAAQV
jgi:hypothetical protein